jgi:hypothetical protein
MVIQGNQLVTLSGLTANIHMPPATKSRYDARGREIPGRLAPFAPVQVYRVDDYPRAPAEWARSGGNLTTCFMGSRVGCMAWFDFNSNDSRLHDVAVILAAQNVNAISGGFLRPGEEPRLCQFNHTCPIHGTEFKPGSKLCEHPECNFAWPDQNYLAASTCEGRFWRDGFRFPNGKTHEFVFGDEVERGVAANLVGDARTDAFEIWFFLSMEPRVRRYIPRVAYFESSGLESMGAERDCTRGPRHEVEMGAEVNQDVPRDPQRLDAWNLKPEAGIRVYYTPEENLPDILGERPVPGGRRGQGGPFGNLPTGH